MATGLYICKFNPPVTSIENNKDIAEEFFLEQNFPNPFNPSTKIEFRVPSALSGGLVSLIVYNILGTEVAILVNEVKSAGTYEVSFEAFNLPSGIYFAKLTYGDQREIIKMCLIK